MKTQRLVVLLAFTGLLVLGVVIGCTSLGDGFLLPGGGSLGARFAFVMNGGADGTGTPSINVYKVDSSTGALSTLQSGFNPGLTTSSSSGHATSFIDVGPNSNFLFVPLPSAGQIAVFSVNQSSGALTAVSGSPFTASATTPYSSKVNPAGTFLYVTNYDDETISAYSIGANGTLTHVGSDLPTASWPHLVLMDPQGRFLYVPNEAGSVDGFKINADGSLTAMAGTPFAADSYSTGGIVDDSGQFLLVANKYSCDPGTVSVYKIDQTTGIPAQVSGSPFTSEAADCGPYTVAQYNAGGQTLILANNYESTPNISVFTFNTSTGALAPVSGSPFALSTVWPHYVATDPTRKFAYVVDFGCAGFCFGNPSTITAMTLNGSGAVTQIAGSPYNNGNVAPTQIVFGE